VTEIDDRLLDSRASHFWNIAMILANLHIVFFPNAKLTHGSLEPAGGSTTVRGEGAEAAEAASVTEPVEL